MNKLLLLIFCLFFNFSIIAKEDNETVDDMNLSKEMSYYIYKSEIDEIYNKCVYNLITTYDDDFENTAYGTAFFEELLKIIDPSNVLSTYEKVMDDLNKLKTTCTTALFDLENKYFHEDYIFKPSKFSKNERVYYYDSSNFNIEEFQKKYQEIISILESRYELTITDSKLTKVIIDHFYKFYSCKFHTRVGATFGLLVGGTGGYGKVKCVDYLGGEYKWGNATMDGFMNGGIISINIGSEYDFRMTKSQHESKIVAYPRDIITAGVVSGEQDSCSIDGPKFRPSLGIGAGSIDNVSVALHSEKTFKKINYDQIHHPFLREVLQGETLWNKIKP